MRLEATKNDKWWFLSVASFWPSFQMLNDCQRGKQQLIDTLFQWYIIPLIHYFTDTLFLKQFFLPLISFVMQFSIVLHCMALKAITLASHLYCNVMYCCFIDMIYCSMHFDAYFIICSPNYHSLLSQHNCIMYLCVCLYAHNMKRKNTKQSIWWIRCVPKNDKIESKHQCICIAL